MGDMDSPYGAWMHRNDAAESSKPMLEPLVWCSVSLSICDLIFFFFFLQGTRKNPRRWMGGTVAAPTASPAVPAGGTGWSALGRDGRLGLLLVDVSSPYSWYPAERCIRGILASGGQGSRMQTFLTPHGRLSK